MQYGCIEQYGCSSRSAALSPAAGAPDACRPPPCFTPLFSHFRSTLPPFSVPYEPAAFLPLCLGPLPAPRSI